MCSAVRDTLYYRTVVCVCSAVRDTPVLSTAMWDIEGCGAEEAHSCAFMNEESNASFILMNHPQRPKSAHCSWLGTGTRELAKTYNQ